jgi:hypothetical protein
VAEEGRQIPGVYRGICRNETCGLRLYSRAFRQDWPRGQIEKLTVSRETGSVPLANIEDIEISARVGE